MGESVEGLATVTGAGVDMSAVILLCAPSPQFVEVAAITGKTGERGVRFKTDLPTARPEIDVRRRSAVSLARFLVLEFVDRVPCWAPKQRSMCCCEWRHSMKYPKTASSYRIDKEIALTSLKSRKQQREASKIIEPAQTPRRKEEKGFRERTGVSVPSGPQTRSRTGRRAPSTTLFFFF